MTREQEKGADKNKGQVSFLLVKDSESGELKELVTECEAKVWTIKRCTRVAKSGVLTMENLSLRPGECNVIRLTPTSAYSCAKP